MEWIGLACRHITETVDQELILRNEYLVAENRILKAPILGGCSFSTLKGPRWLGSVSGWVSDYGAPGD